jgi:hypothetical protein
LIISELCLHEITVFPLAIPATFATMGANPVVVGVRRVPTAVKKVAKVGEMVELKEFWL